MISTDTSRRLTSVTIEYNDRLGRARRTFDGEKAAEAARRFFGEKADAGKRPSVVGGRIGPA
jgi:hypothetical protein